MQRGGVACGLVFLVLAVWSGPLAAQQGATLVGKVSMLDRGDQPAEDLAQAVVWVDSGSSTISRPARADMATQDKQFVPRVVVIAVGSTVTFPNHDGFKHNVFSLSEARPFDLGLYGRGEGKSVEFPQAGVVRIYCNVHSSMSGFVIVADSPWFAQAAGDGTFFIKDVPPGNYRLHAWHERAKEIVTIDVTVPPQGVTGLAIELDASGYKYKAHLNKYGQPYTTQGRRY
jgi:plastocyanin